MLCSHQFFFFFFFNDTATTEIYTLSLHDALPILRYRKNGAPINEVKTPIGISFPFKSVLAKTSIHIRNIPDRKSTRLNSSHANISYAVFCLKKKKIISINSRKTKLSNKDISLKKK